MQIIQGPQYYRVRPFIDLREMLDQSVKMFGDMTAFRFREQIKDEPVTRTYREFYGDCQALGTALLNLGLGGGRLAIVGENSYPWCVADVTVMNGIGVAVPLDRMLPEDELISLLDRGEVDTLFYDASFMIWSRRPQRPCRGSST